MRIAQIDAFTEPPTGLLTAIGAQPLFVGKNEADWLIELESEQAVLDLEPDLRRLGEVSERGVMVTSFSESESYDFVSRFFAPAAGVDEDPVTGSAHCCLGPYWAERLDKTELMAFQASDRGGVIRVRHRDTRVLIGGKAVTVMQGELTVPWPQLA